MCLFPGWKGDNARLHNSCLLEVCSDRQHNKVVKNMGTEARLPGSLVS